MAIFFLVNGRYTKKALPHSANIVIQNLAEYNKGRNEGCTLRIAVCDDEIAVVNQVASILRHLQYEVDCYQNPMDILEQHYPVYFLDIGMKELTGIEAGELIRRNHPDSIIIYLTNFDDYRAQAFGVHAFDYLKKPVDPAQIERVMKDVKALSKRQEVSLSFKSKDGILQIKPTDIYYFEFYDRYILLHAANHTYQLAQNLHTIVEMMKPYHFSMPHKSFCINLGHIRLLKGYEITMINGDIIPLSQKRSVDFRKELNDYLCQTMTRGD